VDCCVPTQYVGCLFAGSCATFHEWLAKVNATVSTKGTYEIAQCMHHLILPDALRHHKLFCVYKVVNISKGPRAGGISMTSSYPMILSAFEVKLVSRLSSLTSIITGAIINASPNINEIIQISQHEVLLLRKTANLYWPELHINRTIHPYSWCPHRELMNCLVAMELVDALGCIIVLPKRLWK